MSTANDIRIEATVLLGFASDTLMSLWTVSPNGSIFRDLRLAISQMNHILLEPVNTVNDLILNQRKLELKACVRDALQKIADLTPSREVENATDTPTTHA